MASFKTRAFDGSRGTHPRLSLFRPSILAVTRLVFPLVTAAPMHVLDRSFGIKSKEEDGQSPDNPSLYVYLGIAIALVLLGGAFAGLTIALMGQDETYLQVIATSGDGSEKRHAERVLGLLKKGKHWVLVTLLLSNVITNETLPIVLDRSLGGGWPAVLSSTVLIVIFGEIVPQSICVRYGLSIGALMAPCVLVLMWIMFPVAWPTAKLLDYLLGEEHGTMYKKAGLKTLVQLHKTLGTTPAERLMEDEVTIINSVLDLKEKPVGDIMTPMGDVFTMSADTILDEKMMDLILSQGYSRIPVYAPEDRLNFIGMLLVKILITYDPEDCLRVRDFALATLPETSPYTSCLDIINFFQEGKSHMVLVSDYPGQPHGALGVVTLEDVIEELIGEEIIDESDVFVDVHKAIRRLAPAPKTRFHQHEPHEPHGLSPADSDREGKDPDEHTPLLESGDTHQHTDRKHSLSNAKTVNILARRKSSNASDSTRDTLKPMPRLNSTDELRQHLKHLGPSNAASRPRATKFSSVKIKPGVGTIHEDQVAKSATMHTAQHNNADLKPPGSPVVSIPPPESETTGLLSTAGKIASDGVAAVASYGSNGNGPNQQREEDANSPLTASEATKAAEENAVRNEPIFQNEQSGVSNIGSSQAPKVVIGTENHADSDSINESKWGSQTSASNARLARRLARSGSITETMVNSGGMKKIVLETTSSSEELDITRSKSAPAHLDEQGLESEHDDESLHPDAASSKGKAKRKRRPKKKKSADK